MKPRVPKASGTYNIKKIREYIEMLNEMLYKHPSLEIDNKSAHLIMRNLVNSLEYSVNTIEYMQEQDKLEEIMKASPVSNAKN